jgi:hypothetical protein
MHPLLVWGAAAGFLVWLFKEDSKMPAVQKYFDEFHARIKLDEEDEKKKLREKRETLLGELRTKLPKDVPAFVQFNQGSYSMHTGVVPLDGNYDIDVGLIFDCKRDKYPAPVELKKKVRDALANGNRTVDIRRPCITVTYVKDKVPEYHVDLVVYAKRDDDKLDLAKGKEHSDASLRVWETSDPKKLTELISNRFSTDEDLAQYRRCIRYMKRWRDYQFGATGGPLSIALTVAAYCWFKPYKPLLTDKYLDLKALQGWVGTMLANFQTVTTSEGTTARLKVMLPVVPNNDLMAETTNRQMDVFKTKLENLRDALDAAEQDALPEEACKILAKQFGKDFPVPPKDDTGKSVKAPYVSTGNSA